MLLAWVVFFVVAICAFWDFKKTVIVWMAVRLLFNPQVALRYETPAMSLDFGIAVLLIMIYIIRNKKNGLAMDYFLLKPIFIATLISYTLSSLFSIYQTGEILRLMAKFAIMNFIILYVFHKALCTSDDVRCFVKAIIFVAIVIGSLGIIESIFYDNPYLDYIYYNSPREGTEGRMYYFPPEVKEGMLQMRYGMVRAYSTFGIHLAFGRACVIIMGMLLIVMKLQYFRRYNWWILAAIILTIAGCITSNSKTCYIGMFVMLMLLTNPSQLLRIRTLGVIAFIVIVVFVLYRYVPNYFDNIFSLFDEDLAEEGGGSTIATRERQLTAMFNMFQQSPILGNGPGALNILKEMNESNEAILGAEGALLSILPERGLLGYLVYLFSFYYIFRSSKRIVPTYLIFIYLLSVFAMEVVSGIGDMTLYWAIVIAIRRTYLLNGINSHLLLNYNSKL